MNRPPPPRSPDGLRSLLRDALRNEPRDYTQGSLRRALALLAIPMMLEMALESVFAVVDIFFVAKLGADAVATVGITEALLTVVYAVAIGLGMSVTAMVSRRIGEDDERGAAIAAGQSIWIGAALAAGTGVLGAYYAPTLLQYMGASEGVVREGSGYTAVILGASGTVYYLFLLNSIFRGAGDANIALRSMWLANGLNLVLDPCLIFGLGPFPELGLFGAGVATSIGRGVGVLYQIAHLTRWPGRVHLSWRRLALVPPVFMRLLRISAGGIAQFMIATASWVLMIRMLATFGSHVIAGFTIAIRLIEFVFLPAWGLGNAAASLVGQNLGAGNVSRAEDSAWLSVRWNVAFMSSVALAFIVLPDFLTGLFTADPQIAEAARTCLRIVALGYPLYAVGMVLTQSFNGAGDTLTPTLLNGVCFWLLQIPLAWWLSHGTSVGYAGVAWAIFIAESLLAVLALLAFRRGNWQRTVV